jgi:hypothetical protein
MLICVIFSLDLIYKKMCGISDREFHMYCNISGVLTTICEGNFDFGRHPVKSPEPSKKSTKNIQHKVNTFIVPYI